MVARSLDARAWEIRVTVNIVYTWVFRKLLNNGEGSESAVIQLQFASSHGVCVCTSVVGVLWRLVVRVELAQVVVLPSSGFYFHLALCCALYDRDLRVNRICLLQRR